MSIFKYVTFDYWYVRGENRRRKKMQNEINVLQSHIDIIDKILADGKANQRDISYCTEVSKIFRNQIEQLQIRLKSPWI